MILLHFQLIFFVKIQITKQTIIFIGLIKFYLHKQYQWIINLVQYQHMFKVLFQMFKFWFILQHYQMYFCREPIISHVSIIKYVMEQNLIGFPNSMYLHVGPHTLYFGFGYGGIGSVPTMWPPMSNPLVNPTSPSKLVLGIKQDEIITNHG
jgi:hypothetical protein